MKTRALIALASAAGVVLVGPGGCAQRRILVTSEPPGARVSINDVDVGVTPLETSFTYYGVYDVRLDKDGFEPLRTRADAHAPIFEYPPIDFAAQAIPADTIVRWNFILTPALERTLDPRAFEDELHRRAAALRSRISGEGAPAGTR